MFVPAKHADECTKQANQCTEELGSWTFNEWSWLLPPGDYGMRVMFRCCGDMGFPLDRHNSRDLLYVIKSLAIDKKPNVASKAGSVVANVHAVSSAPIAPREEFAGHAVSSAAADPLEEVAGQAISGAPTVPLEEVAGQAVSGAPTVPLEESAGHAISSAASTDRLEESAESPEKSGDHSASKPPPTNGPTTGAPEDQSAECVDPWWETVRMPLPLSCQIGGRTFKLPNPKVVVLDMNGVLLKRYNQFPKNELLPKGHKFLVHRVVKGEYACAITCIVRPDAHKFICRCAKMFIPVLWSSCTQDNLTATMVSCFPALKTEVWKDILSQQHCRQAGFKLSEVPDVETSEDKPIFFKAQDDLLCRNPEWQTLKILFVDDTRYKNQLNPVVSMICPPSFDPFDPQQDEYYLTNTLLPWLMGWNATDNPDDYVVKNMLKNDKDMVSSHVMKHWEMLKSC